MKMQLARASTGRRARVSTHVSKGLVSRHGRPYSSAAPYDTCVSGVVSKPPVMKFVVAC